MLKDLDTFFRCHWLIALKAAEEILNHGLAQAQVPRIPPSRLLPPQTALNFRAPRILSHSL